MFALSANDFLLQVLIGRLCDSASKVAFKDTAGMTLLFNYYYYTDFLPKGLVCPADKLQLKASYPLLDSPDPSKTQSTVGTVLSTYTAPSSRGRIVCIIVYMHENKHPNIRVKKACLHLSLHGLKPCMSCQMVCHVCRHWLRNQDGQDGAQAVVTDPIYIFRDPSCTNKQVRAHCPHMHAAYMPSYCSL